MRIQVLTDVYVSHKWNRNHLSAKKAVEKRKNYSGKVVKIAGNNCNFGSHWLLAVNHCNQCSDWLQIVNDCQNCNYYLQLNAVKNHMQWITTIQNRVQSFNCTFTAKVCSVLKIYAKRLFLQNHELLLFYYRNQSKESKTLYDLN